jgi:rod shape-determining protein MreD
VGADAVTTVRAARISLVCFVALVLQTCVTAQLPINGAIVDVVLIATIGAALAAGPEAGAGVGFGCGLVIDLLGAGPVGLTSLVYSMVGYGVGVSQTSVLRSSRLIPLAVSLVAAPVAVVGYAVIGEVIGQDLFQVAHVVTVVIVVTAGVLVGCLPARAAMGWAFAGDDRVALRRATGW